MDDQTTRSRVLGFLLWSAFAVASLLVVMFTFISAYSNDRSSYYPTGATQPSPVAVAVSRTPLCLDAFDPRDIALAIDAEAARRGLVAKTEWSHIAPRAPLPSVAGECSLVAIAPEDIQGGFLVDGPSVICSTPMTFSVVCPTPVKNGEHPVRARVFTLPGATLQSVSASSLPPLVYVTHLLLEQELLHTPLRAGRGVADVGLAPTSRRSPIRTESGCFVWLGVETNGRVVTSANALGDCGGGVPLPAATQAEQHVFLRPYARAPGPHREHSERPAEAPLARMKLLEESRVLATLPRGS